MGIAPIPARHKSWGLTSRPDESKEKFEYSLPFLPHFNSLDLWVLRYFTMYNGLIEIEGNVPLTIVYLSPSYQ